MKEWCGLFCNGAIIGTFAAHLTAAQEAKTVLELKVKGVKPTFANSYVALALCEAKLIYLPHNLLDRKSVV